jgi:hypothetical protein
MVSKLLNKKINFVKKYGTKDTDFNYATKW